MWVYILLGLFIGIVVKDIFTSYIDPILIMKQEVHQYREANNATSYQISAQRQMLDLQREYPELKDDKDKESINAIGFQYPRSVEEYCDDEEEDKNIKI